MPAGQLSPQSYQFVNALPPLADMNNASPDSDIMSLAKGQKLTFILYTGVNATGNANITVVSADDTTPTTTTPIAFRMTAYETSGSDIPSTPTVVVSSSGFKTTSATANAVYVIEVDSSMLSGTDKYVGIEITESTNAAVMGGGFAIIGPSRYQEATMDSAIV